MLTLGINAAFHDTAACLVKDGVVVAAAEEERFTHVKHGKRPLPFTTYELPFHAIDYCLREAGAVLGDLDHVAYSFNPYLILEKQSGQTALSLPLEPNADESRSLFLSPWDPLMLSYIVNAPRHLKSGVPHHLSGKRWNVLNTSYQWHFVDHHIAHASSAYLASPHMQAAVMVLDGRGEHATTSYYRGALNHLEILSQVSMPHSLGLLYEKITSFLGFLHSSDEYKVMALASYGKPTYRKVFESMIKVESRGEYTIENFDLEEKLGPARERGSELEQRHFDIAHSLQAVLEDTVVALARWLKEETSETTLCMAGGVALNCVMNAKVRDRRIFDQVWVQPASGDAGTALGAALWIDRKMCKGETRRWTMKDAYLGPAFTDDEIEKFLKWTKLSYRRLEDVPSVTAAILADDKIVGWFQGRMEFGPRALGARSILASPRSPQMQARLNDLKDREDFRPVAPVISEEDADQWFMNGHEAPFMLFVFDVRSEKAALIPAVRHTDGTARVQTVRRDQHPRYYDLIKEFEVRTGVPVLVNTSFNTRGEPIVCTPRDAIESYLTSPLDALVIGSFLLEKSKV